MSYFSQTGRHLALLCCGLFLHSALISCTFAYGSTTGSSGGSTSSTGPPSEPPATGCEDICKVIDETTPTQISFYCKSMAGSRESYVLNAVVLSLDSAALAVCSAAAVVTTLAMIPITEDEFKPLSAGFNMACLAADLIASITDLTSAIVQISGGVGTDIDKGLEASSAAMASAGLAIDIGFVVAFLTTKMGSKYGIQTGLYVMATAEQNAVMLAVDLATVALYSTLVGLRASHMNDSLVRQDQACKDIKLLASYSAQTKKDVLQSEQKNAAKIAAANQPRSTSTTSSPSNGSGGPIDQGVSCLTASSTPSPQCSNIQSTFGSSPEAKFLNLASTNSTFQFVSAATAKSDFSKMVRSSEGVRAHIKGLLTTYGSKTAKNGKTTVFPTNTIDQILNLAQKAYENPAKFEAKMFSKTKGAMAHTDNSPKAAVQPGAPKAPVRPPAEASLSHVQIAHVATPSAEVSAQPAQGPKAPAPPSLEEDTDIWHERAIGTIFDIVHIRTQKNLSNVTQEEFSNPVNQDVPVYNSPAERALHGLSPFGK